MLFVLILVVLIFIPQWQNGRRGQDGWGKWTRRRKWYRDAELVEVDPSERAARAARDNASLHSKSESTSLNVPTIVEETVGDDASLKTVDDAASVYSTSSKSSFWPPMLRRRTTDRSMADKEKEKEKEKPSPNKRASEMHADSSHDDTSGLGIELEMELQRQGKDGGQWGIGEDARMNLE